MIFIKLNILKKHHGEVQQRIIPTVYDEEGNLHLSCFVFQQRLYHLNVFVVLLLTSLWKRARLESSIVADLVMLKVNGDKGEDQQRIIPTVCDEEEGNLDEVEILAIIQTLDNEQQDEDKN